MKRFGLWLLSALVALCTLSACEGLGGTTSSGGGQSSVVHTHTDTNNDRACDTCGVQTLVTLDFYSINDLHGKIDDTYANIGVDEMTAYLQAARAQNENTVLFSAGDMWQGSAESNFTKGKLVVDWMNELDFSAMAMGNHEFDWGESYIETNEERAEFPFLGINVYDVDTNERVRYCQSSVTLEKGGAKIGVIGAIGDCYSSIAEEQVQGVYFKTDDDLTSLVKAESQKLRAAGADFIVYLLHDAEVSNKDHYDEELSNGYVDLVFEGHSHTTVLEEDSHGVWHLQAGGDNAQGLSHAQVEINLISKEFSVERAQIVEHSAYLNMTDAPIVDELLEKYADELATVNEVLGQNDEYRDTEELRTCMAEGLYLAGEERWGSETQYQGKIVLGGGFINVRSPGYLPAGKVTYGDIYPLFPFDNPIVLCSVSGYRLQKQFIESRNYCCFYGDYGEWVKANLQYSETYYVVVDTYCANYNFQGMGNLPIVEYYDAAHTVFSRDALAEFIRDGKMGLETRDSTIPEILSIGNALADNAETAEKFRIQAEIVNIKSQKYGNMTVKDEDGNELYIYGVYDENGTRYDGMAEKPAVGEIFSFEGKIKKYVKDGTVTVEMIDAVVRPADFDEGYTAIRDIHAQSAPQTGLKVKGRVIAVSAQSFLFWDGTGVMMFYTGGVPSVSVGETVEIVGNTAVYASNQQFKSDAAEYTVKKVRVPEYTAPTPTVWESDDVEGFDGKIGQYVKLRVLVYKNGDYYNCEKLSSSSTRTVSLIAPSDAVLSGLTITETPQEFIVTGYPCYATGSNGKYVNIVLDSIKLASGSGGGTETLLSVTLNAGFGGNGIATYATGNYGEYTVNGTAFEFYRAYTPKDASYLTELLPYIASTSDGTAAGSLYNTSPIYGIRSIEITYKSAEAATLYTGDDRVAAMTAYPLAKTVSYQTVTLQVDTDNFFKIDSGTSGLYIQTLTVFYTGKTVSYQTVKKSAGAGYTRLNATTYEGTLVAGQSAIAVPVKVEYDGGSCLVTQTKTYTYYTLEYVTANPTFAGVAAMTAPADIAAYYAAFGQIPANFAAKNFSGNSFSEVQAVFGEDTRYVSEYSRTTGYAQYVPYNPSNTVYYEFDVALTASYWTNGERGVGRVVSWVGGWDSAEYDDAPVSVYTDDHYGTFQEYLNNGQFGERFDAERSLTFFKWTPPDTVSATSK